MRNSFCKSETGSGANEWHEMARRNEYLGASGMGKAVLQGFRPVFQMPGVIMTRLMPVRRTYFTSAYIGQAPGETGLKPDGNSVF
nr:hypothetical protein [uncultured Ottowia sp.]